MTSPYLFFQVFLGRVCLHLIGVSRGLTGNEAWESEHDKQKSPAWLGSETLRLLVSLRCLGHKDAHDPFSNITVITPRSLFEYLYAILNTFITWNSIDFWVAPFVSQEDCTFGHLTAPTNMLKSHNNKIFSGYVVSEDVFATFLGCVSVQ